MMEDTEIPEGFKMTEIGPLPEEWELIKLKLIFEFSKKPRSLDINKYNQIPFIPMEYIPDRDTYISKYDLRKPEEMKSGTFFFKGDLLVAKITPSFENGKQCIVKELPIEFGYATTEVWPIHRMNETNILYLFYFLKRKDIRNSIAAKMEGTTGRQRVPRSILENLKVSFPPLSEQEQIAFVLSTIQQAIEKTDAVINATKELKKSMMKHLFTYGPVSVEDAKNVVLIETEAGLVPEEWKVVRLGALAESIIDCLHSKKPERKKEGKMLLNVYNIGKKGDLDLSNLYLISKEDFEKWSRRIKPKKDDIVISKVGRVGAIAYFDRSIECATGRNLVVIRPDKDRVHPLYLKYFMLSGIFRNNVKKLTHAGTIHKSLHVKQIPNLQILIPILSIQRKIAEMLFFIDQKIEAEQTKKIALEELFKTLLHNLMTGRIRVNHLEVLHD